MRTVPASMLLAALFAALIVPTSVGAQKNALVPYKAPNLPAKPGLGKSTRPGRGDKGFYDYWKTRHNATIKRHDKRFNALDGYYVKKVRGAIESLDHGQMKSAMGRRIQQGRAMRKSLLAESKLLEIKAHQILTTQGKTKEYNKLRWKASRKRHWAKKVGQIVANYKTNIDQHASDRVARARLNTLTFKEKRQLLTDLIYRKDLPQADRVLRSMKYHASVTKNPLKRNWRTLTNWRLSRQILTAKKGFARGRLRDNLNGRMNATEVKGIVDRMSVEAKKGNWLQRRYKGFKLAWTKRQVRKAAEARAKEAIREGEVGWQAMEGPDGNMMYGIEDQNLLQTFGGSKSAFRKKVRAMWKEEKGIREQQAVEELGLTKGSPEFVAFMKDQRKGFRSWVRENMQGQGSNFIEGLKVLNYLDNKSKRAYAKKKGVRRWVNKQVGRFAGWVLGSPRRSARSAKRELLNRANTLLKTKDVDAHMQASALLLTAKELSVGKTRRARKMSDRAIARVKVVIKQAVRDGDPDAVTTAYDLYQAYGMDSSGADWKLADRRATQYQRDKVKAECNLIDKLTRQAEWIMLNKKKAGWVQYSPVHAKMMNQIAAGRAAALAAEMPGSVPKKLYNRISANKRLMNGSFRGKLRLARNSNFNPLNWPWRTVKYIIRQPLHLLRGQGFGRMPKLPTDPNRMQYLMEKYAQQMQPQGQGGQGQGQVTPEQAEELMLMGARQAQERQQSGAPAASAPPTQGGVGGGNIGGPAMGAAGGGGGE